MFGSFTLCIRAKLCSSCRGRWFYPSPCSRSGPSIHQWVELVPPSPPVGVFKWSSVGSGPQHQHQHQDGRLEPWYSYTHWFPMASAHVMKDGGPEPIPRMQPAMMMFSSKYWSRRGMSLDSAMFDQQNRQQQQKHTGGQMVRVWTLPPLHPPLLSGSVCLQLLLLSAAKLELHTGSGGASSEFLTLVKLVKLGPKKVRKINLISL